MTVGGTGVWFYYDASGTPYALYYGGQYYYYATNAQGDVTAILNTSGTAVVTYTYDAWGNLLTTTGTHALANLNPLRYRGYVYDNETELYYLQSRYYNPEVGRFLNADACASTGQGFFGFNMFAYCLGNPVNYYDSDGKDAIWIQEEHSAEEQGHSGLLVEDEEGNWWYFYWGPSASNNLLDPVFGITAQFLYVQVYPSDEDLRTLDGLQAAVSSAENEFVAERASLITDMSYYEGDYTPTHNDLSIFNKIYQEFQEKGIECPEFTYYLFSNNCVQQTWRAMAVSNERFRENTCLVIPNYAFRIAIVLNHLSQYEYDFR